MNKASKFQQQVSAHVPNWVIRVLPLISLLLGGLALWVTWFFYYDHLNLNDLHWYQWIQPCLMLLTAIMILAAALLFSLRKSSGWDMLELALSLVPITLALRLLIVVVRFVRFLIQSASDNAASFIDGSFLNQLSFSPKLIINLIVVAAIALFVIMKKNKKARKTP